MALTAAQRRLVSRRTTASSRARLRQRLGGQQTYRPTGQGRQQTYTPGMQAAPHPAMIGHSGAVATPQAPAPGGQPGRTPAQFIPDAQYLAQAAQSQFQRQQQINQINAEHTAAVASLGEAQRRLMETQAPQEQQAKESANKAGLFYSGRLGQQLGDIRTNIARQRADMQNQFTGEDQARMAARQAILQGAPLEEAAARAEAVQRQLDRDQTAASQNALAPTPKPRPKPKPKPKPKPRRRRKR